MSRAGFRVLQCLSVFSKGRERQKVSSSSSSLYSFGRRRLRRRRRRRRQRQRQNVVVAKCHADDDDDDDDDDERHRGHEDEEGAMMYLCVFFVVVRATTLFVSRGLAFFTIRCDGMLRRQRRSNPSSSLSLDARLSDFFFLRVPVWCRCRDAVVARAFSSADQNESRSCVVFSNDAHIASEMNSHAHKTHRSNPSNERRKQRRRSLP